MIFKSIRWRLQIWYGLILVAVLTGFGLTAYELEVGRQYRVIDQELQVRVNALLTALSQRSPRPQGPGSGLPDRRPPPDAFDDGAERLPPEQRPERRPPPPPKFQLSNAQAALFGGGSSNDYYYVVWLRDGRKHAESTNAPSDLLMPTRTSANAPEIPRTIESSREVYHVTPLGECVLAGRSIAADMADMRRLGWLLAGVGGIILALGLAGGWWMVSRAIRPIADISDTAVKIAAGDLSQRVRVEEAENELGRLASVLNSTFDRLETAFAQQGRFTADAAHELRTPVSVMLTQTQAALTRERSAAEYRETVEACQRAAQRMRRLIESMLELARLDVGQEPMKSLRFDLSEMMRECIEEVRPLADKHGIKIHDGSSPVEFVGDGERLSRVMTNLLSNAIHYNRDQGEVRVGVRRQHNNVIVSVADSGQGIAAADLPHVFERFYRADESRSGTAGRTGLGLAISKAIVEAHGGLIEVTSQVGVGTSFVVRLPARTVS
jgi:heavy metal sensor kinase